jgi:uncharacterized protein (TIRG00374 family)
MATLRKANVALLVVALGTVLATTLAKATRWKILLRPCGVRIGSLRVVRVLVIGQMANSLLPGRLGDAARAVLLGPWAKGNVAAVVGTLVLEKALDGVAGIIVILALILWTPIPAWLRVPALSLILVTLVLVALLFLAASRRTWTVQLFQWAIHWLPERAEAGARRIMADFQTGLGMLRTPSDGLLALALTAVVWALAALTNVVTMSALGIEAPDWAPWLVLVAVYVANFLPAVPAQVGVFEYACVLALGVAGISPGEALAFGVVLHLVVYAPPAILGPISMASEGLTWSKLTSARREYTLQEPTSSPSPTASQDE